MNDMKVAVVSMENWVGETDRSIERIDEWATKAAGQGAELILFPEMSVGGWYVHPRISEYSQPIPGKISRQIGEIARMHSCIIAYGGIELDNNRFYNTQVLVDGYGLCYKQRKLHLPIAEAEFLSPGDCLDVLDIGKAKIGIALCRDAFFPSTFSTLYAKGAEVVLMPLAYSTMPRDRYLHEHIHASVMRGMCWIHGMYGLFANSAGTRMPNRYCSSEFIFPGWAGVFGPLGNALDYTDSAGNDEAMIVVDLIAEDIRARRQNPHFIMAGEGAR